MQEYGISFPAFWLHANVQVHQHAGEYINGKIDCWPADDFAMGEPVDKIEIRHSSIDHDLVSRIDHAVIGLTQRSLDIEVVFFFAAAGMQVVFK